MKDSNASMNYDLNETKEKLTGTDGPIRLHPDNPHYFIHKGQPMFLITVGEHYGAVINLDFDYIAYLDTLKEFGMNLTRLFSGIYIENEEGIPWMKYNNTLAPRLKRFLAPWKRSLYDGYSGGDCKFDLDQWDEEHFIRLKDFIEQAGKRDIFIEYVFFSQMYDEVKWGISPLNEKNNINGVGKCAWEQFTRLDEEELVRYQEKLVRKVVTELNQYDNIYYEICNEPNGDTIDTIRWHNRMIEVIVSEEGGLPKKHMIAVDYDKPVFIANIHPAVSVHNVHYTWGDCWIGAMELLDYFYEQPRAFALDETVGFPTHLNADEGRVEAWEALVGGCSVYDHLSWAYTPDDAKGNTEEHRSFLLQLKNLKNFMNRFDIAKMKADKSIIASGAYENIHIRALVEPGRQYAVYAHHGKRGMKYDDSGYEVVPGVHELKVGLWIPEGRYNVEWVKPQTGEILERDLVDHFSSIMQIKSPGYSVDIALSIKSTGTGD